MARSIAGTMGRSTIGEQWVRSTNIPSLKHSSWVTARWQSGGDGGEYNGDNKLLVGHRSKIRNCIPQIQCNVVAILFGGM